MRRRGFTLLEIMVVIAIVGLLAGFGGVAGYGLLQSRRFDSGVQSLALAARQARSNALARGETFTFEFTLHDPAANANSNDPPDRYTVYRGRERPASVSWEPLPDKIWIYRTSIAGPPYRWSFDERGTVKPAQVGTIVLQDGTNLDKNLASVAPGELDRYLRSKLTNASGRTRGIIMNTYLGKVTIVLTGNQ